MEEYLLFGVGKESMIVNLIVMFFLYKGSMKILFRRCVYLCRSGLIFKYIFSFYYKGLVEGNGKDIFKMLFYIRISF